MEEVLLSSDVDGAWRMLQLLGLAMIAIIPDMFINYLGVPFYFGGTSLLIMVVVVIDFMAQLNAHMMSHQYESLMKKANLKGSR